MKRIKMQIPDTVSELLAKSDIADMLNSFMQGDMASCDGIVLLAIEGDVTKITIAGEISQREILGSLQEAIGFILSRYKDEDD